MRKARQETVEIWQQRLADKEEEWYLEQEVELYRSIFSRGLLWRIKESTTEKSIQDAPCRN